MIKDVLMFGGSFVAVTTGLSGALTSESGQAVLVVAAISGLATAVGAIVVRLRDQDIAKLRIESDARMELAIAIAKVATDARADRSDARADRSDAQARKTAAVAADAKAETIVNREAMERHGLACPPHAEPPELRS